MFDSNIAGLIQQTNGGLLPGGTQMQPYGGPAPYNGATPTQQPPSFGGGSDWTAGNPFLGQNNPYLQQNINSAQGDVVRNYNLAVKPNTEASMVNSGSFGNSGLMQLQGEQQRQLGDTLGKVSSGMRMQDYNNQQQMYQWDQGFNRGLFNDATQNNQQNMSNYMGLLGQENQQNTTDINNTTTQYNTPLNYQNQFGNMSATMGGQGGTGSSNQNTSGNPIMGAMAGWGLGNQFSGYFNK